MRLSCNGCRILRRGCAKSCSIRPCLDWIKSSESQSNATLFLAKFYGRAGLINLLNAGPLHRRPEIFKSLLYEACGRIVNPVGGSTGLVQSGSWYLCEAAVEAVLRGEPITPVSAELAPGSSSVSGDIRHAAKRDGSVIRKVQSRRRLKRKVAKVEVQSETEFGTESAQLVLSGPPVSHDSEGTRQLLSPGADSGEEDSGSVALAVKPKLGGVELELTLGWAMWTFDKSERSEEEDAN
ncbi:LOB domain-containing protein 40-like [Humulus lupulus]|uniref:LOB domain-containing protein 40-like n=1 Tax=Humulus lupulus TaxID=3486 RepID=UPI002B40C5D3|nr:LOB domain-containing protein 40-like [Humulus lupulus]